MCDVVIITQQPALLCVLKELDLHCNSQGLHCKSVKESEDRIAACPNQYQLLPGINCGQSMRLGCAHPCLWKCRQHENMFFFYNLLFLCSSTYTWINLVHVNISLCLKLRSQGAANVKKGWRYLIDDTHQPCVWITSSFLCHYSIKKTWSDLHKSMLANHSH